MPNQLTRMMPKQTRPITGVMKISSAGRMEMNATDTPASVPSNAARGVMRRTIGNRGGHEGIGCWVYGRWELQ